MKFKVIGISWLFLFAILFYSLRLSVAFFHYAVFNESFTSLYCINQDKPEMQCNGQCHLKLETEKNIPVDNNILNDELHQSVTLFCENILNFQQDTSEYIHAKGLFAPYAFSVFKGYLEPCFQPPDLS